MTLCLKDKCQVSSPGPSPTPPYITSTWPGCQACRPELRLAVIYTRQPVSCTLRPCSRGEASGKSIPATPGFMLNVAFLRQGRRGADVPKGELCFTPWRHPSWTWVCTDTGRAHRQAPIRPPPSPYLASNLPQPFLQEVFPGYAHAFPALQLKLRAFLSHQGV